MKNIVKFLILAIYSTALCQIPAPQVPVTGNIGSGGAFPLLNSGTLIFAADANRNMAYPEMSAAFLKVTSSVPLTAQRNLIAPLANGYTFTVENLTTGGQSIQVIGPTGTGIVIANGSTMTVYCDGTNYITNASSSSGLPVNNPTFTGSLSGPIANLKATSNNIAYADQFSGATADVKIAAAIAQVCPQSAISPSPLTNGIVDARGLTGSQTIAATITMTPNCTLFLGAGTYTRATGAQILFDAGDTIIGGQQQGSGNGGGTVIVGQSGDSTTAVAYRYGVGGGGALGVKLQDLTVLGPATAIAFDLRHVFNSQLINLQATSVNIAVEMGFPGSCDCFNKFYGGTFFGSTYGLDLNAGTNSNQFIGGQFRSPSGSGIYDNGVTNSYLSIDLESGNIGIEFGPSSGADIISGQYMGGNTTNVQFDSGATGNFIVGGGWVGNEAPLLVDNSGNSSNMLLTGGASGTQGGNSPALFAAHSFQLGGNLIGAGHCTLSWNPFLNPLNGTVWNYSQSILSDGTEGYSGGCPLSLGSISANGVAYLNNIATYILANPPAPTVVVPTPGSGANATYYSVCFIENIYVGGGPTQGTSIASSGTLVTNMPTTLSSSTPVNISPNCPAGYNRAYILKNGTSGSVLVGQSTPVGTFQDTGQTLTTFTAVSRNTTGDSSIAGNSTIAGNETVGGNGVATAGTPTVGNAACIKSLGPPIVVGYCSTVVGAGGACTCN